MTSMPPFHTPRDGKKREGANGFKFEMSGTLSPRRRLANCTRAGARLRRTAAREGTREGTGTAMRAHILTVTLRFSPSFGSSPVNLALANSKAVTAALEGPSHNSAVKGSIRNKHTSGLVGPPGHHTSSVFRQAAFVFSASRMTQAVSYTHLTLPTKR